MYSQIYAKKQAAGVVTFPNHAAIAQMKERATELPKKDIKESLSQGEVKAKSTDELLLLTAVLAFCKESVDCDIFSLIAAAILCA